MNTPLHPLHHLTHHHCRRQWNVYVEFLCLNCFFFRYKIWAKESVNRHNNKKKDSRILELQDPSKVLVFRRFLQGAVGQLGQVDTFWQFWGNLRDLFSGDDDVFCVPFHHLVGIKIRLDTSPMAHPGFKVYTLVPSWVFVPHFSHGFTKMFSSSKRRQFRDKWW